MQLPVGEFAGRTVRGQHDAEHAALVLLRQEILLEREIRFHHRADRSQRHDHHQESVAQRPVESASVSVGEPVEAAFERVEERAVLDAFERLEDARGHGRRKCQGDERRDDHRAGDGDGELNEQPSGCAFLEGQGREDGDEGDGDGDDREADFFHSFEGGLHGGQALFHVAIDRLEDDDGVVHHHTDAQHQRQHGEDVDRVAEQIKDGESADDRDRDGDRRNDGRAEIAQKDEDNQHHQQERHAQRSPDLADGPLDIHASVIRHPQFAAGRQRRIDRLNLRPDRLGDADRVGFGLFDHAEEHAGFAGGAGDGAVILDAFLGAADVPHADHGGAVGAQHQIVVFVGRLELAAGLDGHLAVQVLDPTTGQLDVLLAQGAFHVKDGDSSGSHFFRVQPEAHGEAFLPADDDRGDAGHALEPGLDLALG